MNSIKQILGRLAAEHNSRNRLPQELMKPCYIIQVINFGLCRKEMATKLESLLKNIQRY